MSDQSEDRTVLICTQFGGWGVSAAAFLRLRELGHEMALAETGPGETWPGSGSVRKGFMTESFLDDIPRDDPLLIQVWREMGQGAAGSHCTISEVSIPVDVDWYVDEYDGNEHVTEVHRTWP